ncbi:MAG: TetR/AcrR family transcriptional regulator [Sphingomonas sp.]
MDIGVRRNYIPAVMEMLLSHPPKGRPREFCVNQALTAALRVFWTKGFDGASMNDLTEAMGISKPSLYAAFGNKEALFHQALELYEREKLAYIGAAIAEPTARKVAEHLMLGALAAQTDGQDPHGCLSVIHSVACGPEAESIKADVLSRRASSQAAIIARFERAKTEGDLPAHIDPSALTSYLLALLQGMAVQAGSGASRPELEALIRQSMAVWPSA